MTTTLLPPSLLETHAAELLGAPDNWRAANLRSVQVGTERATELSGGPVVPFVKGKSAGHPNWRKLPVGEERSIIITQADHERWLAAWEERTGRCSRCEGAGQVVHSWSATAGTMRKTCRKCEGTGHANA